MSGYCQCKSTDQWYGVADVVAVPVTPDIAPWIEKARAYSGLVLCGTCGLVAPWRGEPVGQITVCMVAFRMRKLSGAADPVPWIERLTNWLRGFTQ